MQKDNPEVIKMIDNEIKNTKSSKSLSSSNKTIPSFKAKKNHVIVHNDERYNFIQGEIYDTVPTKWEPTLIAEGVLKK